MSLKQRLGRAEQMLSADQTPIASESIQQTAEWIKSILDNPDPEPRPASSGFTGQWISETLARQRP